MLGVYMTCVMGLKHVKGVLLPNCTPTVSRKNTKYSK